jgi:hypothetical protein
LFEHLQLKYYHAFSEASYPEFFWVEELASKTKMLTNAPTNLGLNLDHQEHIANAGPLL